MLASFSMIRIILDRAWLITKVIMQMAPETLVRDGQTMSTELAFLASEPGDVILRPTDRVITLRAAWLLSFSSVNTRREYGRDLESWLSFCSLYDVDALRSNRQHVDAWLSLIERTPVQRRGATPASGQRGSTTRLPSRATLSRRVAAISSWHRYLTEEGAIEANPVHVRTRRRVRVDPYYTATLGLSGQELAAFRDAAAEGFPNDHALLEVLAATGVRVGALCALIYPEDLKYDSGRRMITFTKKGGGPDRGVLPDRRTAPALDRHMNIRGTAPGPLFTGYAGGPLTQPYVLRVVQRVARAAGIPQWAELSPHSLRHTYATLALQAGISLRRVQQAMGHARSTTTERYDRARLTVANHPSLELDDYLAGLDS